MYERTLVLIKPDGVSRRLVGEIIGRYERTELRIADMKMVAPDERIFRAHYAEHVSKGFFPALLDFMMSGSTIAMILEGEDAISLVRAINGATDPAKADKGTIRGDLATEITYNLVHGSDSPESAERELDIWFGDTVR